MIKIGNIVTNSKLVNHVEIPYINYYHHPESLSNIDSSLPTLYVGWKTLKESNPDNVLIQNQSILEKRIVSNCLYWEFSFDENKSEHVSGVEMFVRDVPFYYFSSKYKYINYDPIFFNIQSIDELMLLLPKNGIDKVYNFKDEMLYVLKDSQIYGIDLKLYSFFEFDTNRIIQILSKNTKKYVLDSEATQYQEYYKHFPFFEQLKRYIVVLV